MEIIDIVENQMKAAIRSGVSPSVILTAFHNVCFLGDIIEEWGGNVDEESLSELFEGFEISLKALDKMVG